MQITDLRLLQDWSRNLRTLFNDETSYHVGSSLERADFRDVDVRLIPRDEQYDELERLLNLPRLSLCVSLWGKQATGLPIDFQIQRRTEANEEFKDRRRNALGISHWDFP